MMLSVKAYIQNISELSDSREMLESKPHAFMAWFAYLLIAIIAAALVWSYYGEIEEYVRASGVVRPGDNISTVRNALTGTIDTVYMEEGILVQKGDTLYTVDTSALILDQEDCLQMIEKLETERAQLLTFRQSIQEDTNLFNPEDEDELGYYNRVLKYTVDRKANAEQINNANLDLKQTANDMGASKTSVQTQLTEANELYTQQSTLLASIEQKTDLFEQKDSEYHRRFEDYLYSQNRLDTAYTQAVEAYDNQTLLYESGIVTQKDVENAKRIADSAKQDADKFRNESIMSVQQAVNQTRQNIQDLTNAVNKWDSGALAYGGRQQDVNLMLDKMKLDMLVQIEDSLVNNKANLDKVNSDLRSIALSLEKSVVVSPITGILNMYTEINAGDIVQPGMEIATIIPDTGTNYKIQLMVSNKDIASINGDQIIRYHFHALPYREYGEASGIVQKIGTDARVEQNQSYYLIEATIDETELTSYKGDTGQIKVGMACDAQVVTQSKKILFWLLEKINLVE